MQAAENAIQIGGGIVMIGNAVLLIKLAFSTGRVVQQIDDLVRRVGKIEEDRDSGCNADDCPIRKGN